MRSQAANMPPYDPPKATTGLREAPDVVDLMWSISVTKSASACSELKYPTRSSPYHTAINVHLLTLNRVTSQIRQQI